MKKQEEKIERIRMISDCINGQKKCLFFIIFFTVVSSIALSFSAYLDKEIVDSIQRLQGEQVVQLLLLYVVLDIVMMGVSNQLEIKKMKFSYNTSMVFTRKVIRKIRKIRFEVLEDRKNLDQMERVYEQSEQIAEVMEQMIQLFSGITIVISYSIVLGSIAWYFPIIIIGLTIPYFWMLNKQGFERYEQEVELSTDTRKIDYLFHVLSRREYQKEIKTFQLGTYLSNKYFLIRKNLWDKRKKLLLRHSFMTIGITFVKNLSFLFCMIITAVFIVQEKTTIGSFMLLFHAIGGLRSSTVETLEILGDYQEKGFYFHDVYEFMQYPEDGEKEQKLIDGTTIQVNNLSFRYPNGKEDALSQVTTTIYENEIVAIVGENGSGKSTFVHLLLGLYEPQTGSVQVGSHSLQEVVDDLRKKTGCILQNFNQYQMSIKENLLVGKTREQVEWKQVKQLLAFIEEFPKGVDTELGQLEEKGIDLSGGNWQRIALGRAFLKPDTKFLILDEPVSAFDPKIENEFYEQLRTFCKNKTTLLISHRLSVTKVCDRILVFHKGKLVEEGTHKQLMEQQGQYYKMYQAQQSLYS